MQLTQKVEKRPCSIDLDQFERTNASLVNPCPDEGIWKVRRIDVMKCTRQLALAIVAWAGLLSGAALADESAQSTSTSFVDALTGGEFSASFRYRYAYIDQDGKPEEARAALERVLSADIPDQNFTEREKAEALLRELSGS
jgi:Tfp pilus assembly protein FimV